MLLAKQRTDTSIIKFLINDHLLINKIKQAFRSVDSTLTFHRSNTCTIDLPLFTMDLICGCRGPAQFVEKFYGNKTLREGDKMLVNC